MTGVTSKAEETFEVSQWLGGKSAGRYGIPCFKAPGDGNPSMYGLNPEGLLGRRLPAGSKLRITVEVIEEGPELLETTFCPPTFRGGSQQWSELAKAERSAAWDAYEAKADS